MKREKRDVEVARLVPDPRRVWRSAEMSRALANEFEDRYFGRILVHDTGTELHVLDGMTRVEAARALGRETVPAYVYTDVTEMETARIIIDANTVRRS